MTDVYPARPRSPVRVADDGWRIPDVLWERIEPLLPPRKPHPLGCHILRVLSPQSHGGDFLGLVGCQWGALDATGLCSHSAAHRRFQEWVAAGASWALWQTGLLESDGLKGLDWSWLSMDGCQTKAPLGGEKHRGKSDRPGQAGRQAQPADGSRRCASGPRHRGRQPPRHEVGQANAREYPGGAADADPTHAPLELHVQDESPVTTTEATPPRIRLAPPPTSGRAARKRRPSSRRRDSGHDGGWWSGRIAGHGPVSSDPDPLGQEI